MNHLTFSAIIFLFTIGQSIASDDQLKNKFNHCQSIENNKLRLECFDKIAFKETKQIQSISDNDTQNDDHLTKDNHFPILIADLNEPNLMLSFGELDLLGRKFNAALISAGNRHLIKNIEFPNGQTFSFNAVGQIRSQFDVDEIDTRNNRGGALINTDFSFGGEIVKSMKTWDWRLSYIHRSTHLGDEFLIDNPQYLTDRLNLSYETIRWDAAKSINNWDFYGGVGFISRSEPSSLNKFMWQSGFQYQGQWNSVKPILAVDLTSWGAYDWNINVSMRAGLEIVNLTHTPFQLFFEYQDGHSPYGQFFTNDQTYTGFTLLKNW